MNDIQRSMDALLGQFRHLHTDINGISVLIIEFKNTNRNEAITLGVGGSSILRQGIADIHDEVDDEKWRQVVAKLPDSFLEQDVPENLSFPAFLEQLVQEVLSPVP